MPDKESRAVFRRVRRNPASGLAPYSQTGGLCSKRVDSDNDRISASRSPPGRTAVTINIELLPDVRVIPLDGRPHLPSNVRLWFGDSIGHWDGNTLVVDTTNFTNKASFRDSDESPT